MASIRGFAWDRRPVGGDRVKKKLGGRAGGRDERMAELAVPQTYQLLLDAAHHRQHVGLARVITISAHAEIDLVWGMIVVERGVDT